MHSDWFSLMTYWRTDIQMTSSFKLFLILYYIKQIDSKLPHVCSVIDHRGCQNVVKTSVTHLAVPHVPLFLFLPHFDVICDLLQNRHTKTWNLFVKCYLSLSVINISHDFTKRMDEIHYLHENMNSLIHEVRFQFLLEKYSNKK